MQAKPFIKWVGGKTQLLPKILPVLPEKFDTYYEPFIGGGAVFFALQAEGRFRRACLSDLNAELINVYRVVQGFPEDLMEFLQRREADYIESPEVMYATYRNPPPDLAELWKGPVQQAGRFIFLNKAGFNGLYRVNRKGEFNVPWSKKAVVKAFERENILACSQALGAVSLQVGDFLGATQDAREGDVVYFDPPYVPLNPTSNFTSYTSDGFGLPAQERLAQHFKTLADRGVFCVLSNSDTQVIRDLYAGFEILTVEARRNVNSKGDGRGAVNEVLVVGRAPGATGTSP